MGPLPLVPSLSLTSKPALRAKAQLVVVRNHSFRKLRRHHISKTRSRFDHLWALKSSRTAFLSLALNSQWEKEVSRAWGFPAKLNVIVSSLDFPLHFIWLAQVLPSVLLFQTVTGQLLHICYSVQRACSCFVSLQWLNVSCLCALLLSEGRSFRRLVSSLSLHL